MRHDDWKVVNEETRRVWDENADYWDQRMGEGNDFVEKLIWPAVERLMALQPGEHVLDAACGNGLTSRRLAAKGATVLGFDFSSRMIEHARRRSTAAGSRIEYRVVDATDEALLAGLGDAHSFDAALCNMALFDMAEVQPLLNAVAQLLRPGGRFVFSIVHPCFNNPYTSMVAEQIEAEGRLSVKYSVNVPRYLTPGVALAVAMRDQPEVQLSFHRPLQVLLVACFQAGFVLDGLEERAFLPDVEAGSHILSWSGKFSEIPPVLVARVRVPVGPGGEENHPPNS
jgi:2-polyprenyl-3-methyl-5-hydroxy-6-metoxy-1,4-benzoquinol methylase